MTCWSVVTTQWHVQTQRWLTKLVAGYLSEGDKKQARKDKKKKKLWEHPYMTAYAGRCTSHVTYTRSGKLSVAILLIYISFFSFLHSNDVNRGTKKETETCPWPQNGSITGSRRQMMLMSGHPIYVLWLLLHLIGAFLVFILETLDHFSRTRRHALNYQSCGS